MQVAAVYACVRVLAEAVAKNTIGLTIATEEYGGKFFANGAVSLSLDTNDERGNDSFSYARLRTWEDFD